MYLIPVLSHSFKCQTCLVRRDVPIFPATECADEHFANNHIIICLVCQSRNFQGTWSKDKALAHISQCIVKATNNSSKPYICSYCLQTLWLKWPQNIMSHQYYPSTRRCILCHISIFSCFMLLSLNIISFSNWCTKLLVNRLTNISCWNFHWLSPGKRTFVHSSWVIPKEYRYGSGRSQNYTERSSKEYTFIHQENCYIWSTSHSRRRKNGLLRVSI